MHAAEQLAKRLGLSGIMVGGTLPASDYDYGFVVVGRQGFEN